MQIRLGYCCISLGKYESKFKTLTLTRAKNLKRESEKLLVEKLYGLWNHNLEEYSKVLNYNLEASIKLYRITSELFPLADAEEFEDYWNDFKKVKSHFNKARGISEEFVNNNGRLCAHQGQFVSLGSASKKVRKNSIKNLELHSEIFGRLSLPQGLEAPLNIHLSCGKDNIKNLPFFNESINSLTPELRNRLVFETEDKSFWTWQNIRTHFPEFPVTLDFHHRKINNLGESEEEAFDACAESWGETCPLMHISEGKKAPLDRSHHDWVYELPKVLLDAAISVDLEIEAKKKDLATLFLKSKYKDIVI
jgi:UV DNA damage endonuclease